MHKILKFKSIENGYILDLKKNGKYTYVDYQIGLYEAEDIIKGNKKALDINEDNSANFEIFEIEVDGNTFKVGEYAFCTHKSSGELLLITKIVLSGPENVPCALLYEESSNKWFLVAVKSLFNNKTQVRTYVTFDGFTSSVYEEDVHWVIRGLYAYRLGMCPANLDLIKKEPDIYKVFKHKENALLYEKYRNSYLDTLDFKWEDFLEYTKSK